MMNLILTIILKLNPLPFYPWMNLVRVQSCIWERVELMKKRVRLEVASLKNAYFAWEGDMLVKKTLVFLGSIFFRTHLNILFIAMRYASSVDISTISFTSSSKDPSLKKFKPLDQEEIILIERWISDFVEQEHTRSSSSSRSSTKDRYWILIYQRLSSIVRAYWLNLF